MEVWARDVLGEILEERVFPRWNVFGPLGVNLQVLVVLLVAEEQVAIAPAGLREMPIQSQDTDLLSFAGGLWRFLGEHVVKNSILRNGLELLDVDHRIFASNI